MYVFHSLNIINELEITLQIVIGPSTIDFGEVAIRTVNTKPLVIVNHLDIHIFIQIDIDCRELRQSLPLTQVIPPRTLSKVDVVFESQKSGIFQRQVEKYSSLLPFI